MRAHNAISVHPKNICIKCPECMTYNTYEYTDVLLNNHQGKHSIYE